MATASEPRQLRSGEIARLDPYVFMAVLGPVMLERAQAAVRDAGLEDPVAVQEGDI